MKNSGYMFSISAFAMVLIFIIYTQKGYANQPVENKMDKNINYEIATVAGGCFWCVEAAFEKIPGVLDVVSGYSGGHVENPSYQEVTSGTTGHYEAVQIKFNPKKVTYNELLNILFTQIDPTDDSGSFVDRGTQYASAIFYHNDLQKKEAEALIEQINNSRLFDDKVATKLIAFKKFYAAEEYHQNYHQKNPIRYNFYRYTSGRDQFIAKVWDKSDNIHKNNYKKPSKKELKIRLSPMEYKVTQKDGTEPAFDNKYWNNKESGIYVDIVSGEPLFSSTDKFQSGTGWPSFTKPLEKKAVVEKQDSSFFMDGREVRSKKADSHLGHVFSDGPEPTGLRYCINSSALKFVPVKDLEKNGLEKYQNLFE